MALRVVESVSDVPLPLPSGLTIVPVSDPVGFAAALAQHAGARLCAAPNEAERILARRTLAAQRTTRAARDAEEVQYLRSLLTGGTERPPLPPHGASSPFLLDLAHGIDAARTALRDARVELLKREGVASAEARRGPGQLAGVEPELARRAASNAVTALEVARAAYASLGKKPAVDREAEQVARRALSRREDASFALELGRARVQRLLAAGNIVGLLLALAGILALVTGADVNAPSVYTMLGLAGASPIVALAAGSMAVHRAKVRLHQASADCDAALADAGATTPAELAARRSELEAWLARADETAEARDAWHPAKEAWEAMAGEGADPAAVEELLAEAGASRTANAAAQEARAAVEDATDALLAAETAVNDRLRQIEMQALGAEQDDGDQRALVVAGSENDAPRLRLLAGPSPVALVTPLAG